MNSSPIDLIHLIERLHRLSLDVVRMEIKKQGIRDLSGVQAMILAHINEKEIVVRDLVERGYYQGSNVSYNVRKLTELGYLEQRRAEHDKRSVIIRLTDKALGVAEHIRSFDADFLREADGELDAADALPWICAYLVISSNLGRTTLNTATPEAKVYSRGIVEVLYASGEIRPMRRDRAFVRFPISQTLISLSQSLDSKWDSGDSDRLDARRRIWGLPRLCKRPRFEEPAFFSPPPFTVLTPQAG